MGSILNYFGGTLDIIIHRVAHRFACILTITLRNKAILIPPHTQRAEAQKETCEGLLMGNAEHRPARGGASCRTAINDCGPPGATAATRLMLG